MEPGEKPRVIYPTIAQAFALLGLLVVFSVSFAALQYFLQDQFGQWPVSLGTFLGYSIPFALTWWVGHLMRKDNKYHFGRVPGSVYLLFIPVVIALIFLREPLIAAIPMPEAIQAMFEELFNDELLTVITIAIIAPIVEEFLFRGVILEGFLQRYSPQKAILWSAVIFGIAHLNPWQFISAFLLGVIIGWVYWRSRSLWICIFIHVFNNAIPTMLLFFPGMEDFGMEYTTRELLNNDLLYGLLLLLSLLTCVGAYFFLHRTLQPEVRTQDPSPDEDYAVAEQ